MQNQTKFILILAHLLVISFSGRAQVTTDPVCFSDVQQVKIIYDATKGTSGLAGASKVYMHAGVIIDSSTGTGWEYVVGNWGQDDGIGQMSPVAGETDKWEITLTPRTYFSVPSNVTIYRLGMVFRNADGSREGKNDSNGDIFVDVSQSAVELIVSSPANSPYFVDADGTVEFLANTCGNVDYTLEIDGVEVSSVSDASEFSFSYTVSGNPGDIINATLSSTDGTTTDSQDFEIFIRAALVEEPRPAGIIDGINYNESDPTSVTLSLWAPLKNSVYLVGDFNNWQLDPAYQLKKDGEHFWIELTGLTAGQEYGYQYYVDESIWIADPYADKILDPDDRYIPASTYPGLKQYPSAALRSSWSDNRVAVFQTNQTPYSWINTDFIAPDKEELVIYELLVRDFLGEENMNYQALIDTLGYIEKLGVNAIELMPIMEFNGNDSWGYNPTFMFAVDKAYGTKNDLKEFIDAAHGRGMAVILDMVMNQNDIPSPYCKMYFDTKPTTDNPWFNRDATHPFNVFFDINHESEYTKAWLDTVNHYWLNEFHFDGYRFDLSKGFTQKQSGDNVASWSGFDASRIAILKRMADAIWAHSPDAYVILEHLGENTEEKNLSDYGMMLWGNVHNDYKEANLGFADGKSFEWAYAAERGWENNHLVSYMESHDEQRQVFEMLNYGNNAPGHDVRNRVTALNRAKATAAFLFLVPGPKLLWQFGEFGYDVDIDLNGRTGRKPTKWEYLDDPLHQKLLVTYSEIIGLKNRYDVFRNGEFDWQPNGELKRIHIQNADTAVTVLGNFDMESRAIIPNFQRTGTWYDFFTGKSIEVSDAQAEIELAPGSFRIYTDKRLHLPDQDIILGIEERVLENVSLFPNPVESALNLILPVDVRNFTVKITDLSGRDVYSHSGPQSVENEVFSIRIDQLPQGMYLVKIESETGLYSELIYKK